MTRPWWRRWLGLALLITAVASGCGPSRRKLCLRNAGAWVAVNCHEEDSPICTTADYECRNARAEDGGP